MARPTETALEDVLTVLSREVAARERDVIWTALESADVVVGERRRRGRAMPRRRDVAAVSTPRTSRHGLAYTILALGLVALVHDIVVSSWSSPRLILLFLFLIFPLTLVWRGSAFVLERLWERLLFGDGAEERRAPYVRRFPSPGGRCGDAFLRRSGGDDVLP